MGPRADVGVLEERKSVASAGTRNCIIQSVVESLYFICKQSYACKYFTRLTNHVNRIMSRFLVTILKLNNFFAMWNMSDIWDDVIMVLRSSMGCWKCTSLENVYNFLLFNFFFSMSCVTQNLLMWIYILACLFTVMVLGPLCRHT